MTAKRVARCETRLDRSETRLDDVETFMETIKLLTARTIKIELSQDEIKQQVSQMQGQVINELMSSLIIEQIIKHQ